MALSSSGSLVQAMLKCAILVFLKTHFDCVFCARCSHVDHFEGCISHGATMIWWDMVSYICVHTLLSLPRKSLAYSPWKLVKSASPGGPSHILVEQTCWNLPEGRVDLVPWNIHKDSPYPTWQISCGHMAAEKEYVFSSQSVSPRTSVKDLETPPGFDSFLFNPVFCSRVTNEFKTKTQNL